MPVAMVFMEIIKSLIDMKNILLTFALLLLTKFSVSAVVDTGIPASKTPYDAYLAPVRQVYGAMHGEETPMQKVEALMRQGRGFRYVHSEPYYPASPEQTAASRKGDCKDKALWLINQLQDPSARFVIGKEKRGAAVSHAWVMWQHEGQWWILDCTMNSRPVLAANVSADKYVPLYSYTKGASFRHDGNSGLASVAGQQPQVAAKGSSRIAAN